jgi:hypothetical protein
MKLYYDKKSKDPTYYVQIGIRNGKKVTSKNIAKIGKHSELLKITNDPLAYAKEQIAKYNEETKTNIKVDMEIHLDFAEKIKSTGEAVSASTLKNVGYLYLQRLYYQLEIDKFFNDITKDRKFFIEVICCSNLLGCLLSANKILANFRLIILISLCFAKIR